MQRIYISHSLQKRLLLTRESAHALHDEVCSALREGDGWLLLDFAGVEGVSPSFLDELLQVVRQAAGEEAWPFLIIRLANPPTPLSSKFEAVGRGHKRVVRQSDEGDWMFTLEEAATSGSNPS